ncbi:TadE family protein [Bremerella sp. JC770]|uniref:TadE family protein n=1 Tax=Bremerella sp. JC770 TaxID=3232137 RepID=UPI0034574813
MVLFRKTKRRAASLLEIIIGLPIVLILLLAVMQFGLLQSNQQTLKMASRAGAMVASELVFDGAEQVPPAEIVVAIDEVLIHGGLLSSDETIESVGDVQLDYVVYDYGDQEPIKWTAPPEPPCNPPATVEPSYYYVQVTICIPATRLAPNTLAYFGIDFSSRDVIMTSLYRHERSPVSPIPTTP